MKKIIITLVVLCVSSLALLNAQQKTQKELFQATYNNSKALAQKQQFSFVGEVVFSNKKRETLDGESNTVKIDKSEISGEIKLLSSDNSSFNFDGNLKNYKVAFDDDKQQIAIVFNVNQHEVLIDIKPNGNAFLSISSSNNNAISWRGKIE
ncbi:hypothetical protein FBALC1_09013 [Flavobacteriales bacterium ALC-1]|nr:hypothetical protein FBALC1_09013 [Flavobacteriales bacterium ALC-1]